MAAGNPVTGIITLQIPAGQANPAPPVGPALGQKGVNIMAFCKEFNAATQKQAGLILPVIITVYKDKTFSFILKSPPASGKRRRSSIRNWVSVVRWLGSMVHFFRGGFGIQRAAWRRSACITLR